MTFSKRAVQWSGVVVGLFVFAACASSPTPSPTPVVAAAASTAVSPTSAPPVNPTVATVATVAATAKLAANTSVPVSAANTRAPVIIAAATRAATVAATADVPLAAIVNSNGRITIAQLDAEVARQLAARQSLAEPPPADLKAFRSSILDSLVQQTLIEQAAAIQGIVVTDQDVDAEVQKYIQAAGGHDKWLAQIATDHMTEADYRAGVRSALVTLKMRDFVTRNIGTTADQVHAKHILVADLVTAQQVLAQLKANADFTALAAQYSLDVTTKKSGGDLGWFTRGQLLQPAIENAAFSAPLNQYTQPIQTDLGYDILDVLERASNRPLDPSVRARLSEQTFEIWLQTLLKAAHITKFV